MRARALAKLLVAAALGLSCLPDSPRAAHAPARTGGPVVLPATADAVLARVRRGDARATMVNVWATWCAPCRAEFPAMLRVAEARRARGFRLVLVSADFPDQLPAVREFLRAHGIRDTSWIETGPPMAFIDSLERSWSGALPATFVYDDGGRRVAFWEGAADSTRFATAADRALAPADSVKETHP